MATATVQIPATGTYRIDPASSSVSFTTRHMFGLGAVNGTFGVVSGEVTIADPVTASTARAVIDAASFSSGHPQRDKDVKSANLLHVQEHPHIKSSPRSWCRSVTAGCCEGSSPPAAIAPRWNWP
jgi:polyisoprenoid-binding protein YceI